MNYSFQELGLDREESDSELVNLFHILDACAKGEHERTPVWAAYEINELTIKDLDGMGDYLFGFWSLLVDMVIAIDVDHPAVDRLVGIIAELKKLPSTQVNIFKEKRYLWEDLQVLEMELLERFSALANGDPTISKEDQDYTIRVNSLAARLLPLGLSSTRPTETLQLTLEEEPWVDWDLEAASEYILRAGESIFESLNEPKFAEMAFKGGSLYTGPKSVNRERWDYWKTRFRECGHVSMEGGRAQRKAFVAADKMAAIDAESP